MKDRKLAFRYFTIAGWKKEQDFLTQQHKIGWKLDHVSFLGIYHFIKCTPEDVVYQLDYNSEGLKHKAEYVQIFHDCGWEYIQDYAGYSYFRKPAAEMNDSEEIYCDDSSRLDMMNRVFKERMIPLIVIFFCIIIPQCLHGTVSNVVSGAFGALGILYFILFLSFAYQYQKYKMTFPR